MRIQIYVIEAHWFGGRSLVDLGAEMGISSERARQIEEQGFKKLRRLLWDYRPRGYIVSNGLQAFRRTGTSGVERAALLLI